MGRINPGAAKEKVISWTRARSREWTDSNSHCVCRGRDRRGGGGLRLRREGRNGSYTDI